MVWLALTRLEEMKGVSVLRAREVKLCHPEDRRIYVQIDGEASGHLPAEVTIVPDALTLLVPPSYTPQQ